MSPNIAREYDKYLFQLFLLLLLWAPIPLGSNRPWSAMLLVFVSAALLSIWLILFLKDKVSSPPAIFHARWVLLSLACFQLWVLVHSFALPAFFVSYVSPEAVSHYQKAGLSEWAYLSLNVDSSLKAFVLGLGLSLAFVLTLLLVTSAERKHLFYKTLVLSGLLQASIGILMVFIDHEVFVKISQLFHSNDSSASGTFVNSNHFAGYLNICLAIGIGLFVSQLKKNQRSPNLRVYLRALIKTILSSTVRLRIYLMIMLIGLVMSYSRMGNLAFFTALTASAALMLLLQKKLNPKMLVLLISLLVIDVLVVGAWFGSEKLVDRIQATELTNNTRTEINAISKPIMLDYFFTGVGADAYKVIEPAYNAKPSEAITEHAHNDYYEFMINTGLVGFACLLVFMTLIIWQIFHFATVKYRGASAGKHHKQEKWSQLDFGLIMLIIYLAVHSLADFNLHIPAFAYTVLACLALGFISFPNRFAQDTGL